MDNFKQYILDELGVEEVSATHIAELKCALGVSTIKKLKTKEYRLLSLDNFNAYFGEDSDLLVSVINCKSWFEIALYKNPNKTNETKTREKQVINSMKCCQTRKCEDCFYEETMDCMETMLQDAIAIIDSKREIIAEYEDKIKNGVLKES